MSDNKYIIDKDSLTGIADAIRNKLGNGASIDDPAAGYYPDPTKSTFLAKFSTVGGRRATGTQRYCHIPVCGMTAADHAAAFGNTPCRYIKVTVLGNIIYAGVSTGEFYFMPYFGSYGTKQRFNWAEGTTFLMSVPSDFALDAPLAFMFSWQDSNNYKQKYDITVPEVQVEFLDANQELMTSAIGGFSDYFSNWSEVSGSGDTVHTFEGEAEYSPIPYSIKDMQDKIEDYWNPPTGSLDISANGTYDVTDKASAVVNVSSSGGGGTLETWKWFDAYGTYSTFPSDFSVENLKDLTCGSGSKGYPRCLYKDSLGKLVSMKDQEISLPSSFSNIGSPLTEAKISAAHNEGRTFCIPWNWSGTKTIPDDVSFIWFVVEPNDSKIYLGAGRYINYVGNGYWAVIYT